VNREQRRAAHRQVRTDYWISDRPPDDTEIHARAHAGATLRGCACRPDITIVEVCDCGLGDGHRHARVAHDSWCPVVTDPRSN